MASRLPHYCVVGGGITGLATAYFISLIRPPGSYRLTLLESSSRFGGWIHSVRNEKTGAVHELGPHSARSIGSSANLLVRMALSLNLENSFIWMHSHGFAGRKYIYASDELLPISLLTVRPTKPFSRSPLLLFTRRMFSPKPSTITDEDISVDEFLRTRFDDEFADYFGSAMMRGIYAGDPRHLSAKMCLPQLVRCELKGPNLLLGLLKSAFTQKKQSTLLPSALDSVLPHASSTVPQRTFAWSLHGGMQSLTDSISTHLANLNPHVMLHRNASVNRINKSNGNFNVHWNSSEITDVNALFLCCPSHESAHLLSDILPIETNNRLSINRLPWTDVATACLEFESDSAQPPVQGFGHLVPYVQDTHILGVVYDSVALPQLDGNQKTVRYTVMMKPECDWLSLSDQAVQTLIRDKAINVIKQHLRIPHPKLTHDWCCIHRRCIPQYPLGHVTNIEQLRREIQVHFQNDPSNLHLAGFSYDGVGMGDAVLSAANAVSEELGLNN